MGDVAGDDGAAIPFLRYRPERLTRSARESRRPCASGWPKRPPSSPSRATTRSPSSPTCSVRNGADQALHDRILAARGRRRPRADPVLPRSGISVWQWAWAPVQVVDRDPMEPDRFRILHTGSDPGRGASPRPAGTRATVRRVRARRMTRAARPAGMVIVPAPDQRRGVERGRIDDRYRRDPGPGGRRQVGGQQREAIDGRSLSARGTSASPRLGPSERLAMPNRSANRAR